MTEQGLEQHHKSDGIQTGKVPVTVENQVRLQIGTYILGRLWLLFSLQLIRDYWDDLTGCLAPCEKLCYTANSNRETGFSPPRTPQIERHRLW